MEASLVSTEPGRVLRECVSEITGEAEAAVGCWSQLPDTPRILAEHLSVSRHASAPDCLHGSVYFASSSGSFSQEHYFQTLRLILSCPLQWSHSHSKTPSVRHDHTLKMSSWPNGTNLKSQHQDQAPEQDSRKMREKREREKERETCHWCVFLLASRP